MISFSRGNEPLELFAIRLDRLAALTKKFQTTGQHPTNDDINWKSMPAVRKALWERQQKKCCYCEDQICDSNEPLEHYRPKGKARRQPGCSDEHGYWWLTYTWENLLLACGHCNSKKLDKFPLASGSVILGPGESPPGDEKPLIIDPAVNRGVNCIQFCWQRWGARERWYPLPRRGISDEDRANAEKTIQVCGLNQNSMLDKYASWVEGAVMSTVRLINLALETPDEHHRVHRVKDEFERAQLTLLHPMQRFITLSYDALVHYTGDQLAQLGHTWPMPT